MCRKCWSWPSHPTPMTSNTNLKLSRKREASHQRSHLQRCQPGLHNVTGIESSWLASYYWMSDVCDKGIWVLSWVEFWTSVFGSTTSVSSPLGSTWSWRMLMVWQNVAIVLLLAFNLLTGAVQAGYGHGGHYKGMAGRGMWRKSYIFITLKVM